MNRRLKWRRQKRIIRLILWGLACLAVVGAYRALAPLSKRQIRVTAGSNRPSPVSLPARAALERRFQRPVYPYSVIRGGAYDGVELSAVLHTDPVAAVHYADFGARSVRTVQLAESRRAYVSFRKDNRIYWTSRPLLLAKGETVLTDGTHEARARCGNRISDTPQKPVMEQDPNMDWDQPIDLGNNPIKAAIDPHTPSSVVFDIFAPMQLPAVDPEPPPIDFSTPPPPPPHGLHIPETPPPPAIVVRHQPPEPSPAPEPAPILLVGAGLLALRLCRRK